jgi:hypothetical protein
VRPFGHGRPEGQVGGLLWLAKLDLQPLVLLDPLAKPDEISERVDRPHLKHSPRCLLQAWSHIAITLRADFTVESFDAIHHDTNPCTRAAVPVMFAQMQDQVAPLNLAVEWSTLIKAVIPIYREAEKPLIELLRLGDIEDAQNGNGRIEADFHDPFLL